MQTSLNILVSLILFSLLLMLLMNVDSSLKVFSRTISADKIAQEQLVNLLEIINHDFSKIGYSKNGLKFRIGKLDSNQIGFYSDIDNDGKMDSLYYHFDLKESNIKSNSHIHPLFRKVNQQSKQIVGSGVVYFNIAYLNEEKNPIPYSSLGEQEEIEKIRGIRVRVRVETLIPIDNKFGSIYWEKTFFPRNLNL